MNRRTFASLIALLVVSVPVCLAPAMRQPIVSNTDYTAVPPFVSNTTTPKYHHPDG